MQKTITDKLAKLFDSFERVTLAYLFGSLARGRAGKNSDADIGVLCKGEMDAEEKLDLTVKLSDETEAVFKRRTDIVLLNYASPFIKYQVLKHGNLIFERETGGDANFRFRTMTEYFDALALQNFFYAKCFKRRRHG